jgi:predicted nucleic acid-binding protein
MKSDDPFFVDANVLVYAAMADDVRNEASKRLLHGPDTGTLLISPQILAEFYSTVTSPKRVSIPQTPQEAADFIDTLLSYPHVKVLPVSREVSMRWLEAVRAAAVKGPYVFDFLILATMLTHGVSRLVTYNTKDFAQFSAIQVEEPA